MSEKQAQDFGKLVKEGMLKKKSPTALVGWQPRNFRLHSQALLYSPMGKWMPKEKQCILLSEIEAVKHDSVYFRQFDVVVAKQQKSGLKWRSYKLQGETKEDVQEWMIAIETAVHDSFEGAASPSEVEKNKVSPPQEVKNQKLQSAADRNRDEKPLSSYEKELSGVTVRRALDRLEQQPSSSASSAATEAPAQSMSKLLPDASDANASTAASIQVLDLAGNRLGSIPHHEVARNQPFHPQICSKLKRPATTKLVYEEQVLTNQTPNDIGCSTTDDVLVYALATRQETDHNELVEKISTEVEKCKEILKQAEEELKWVDIRRPMTAYQLLEVIEKYQEINEFDDPSFVPPVSEVDIYQFTHQTDKQCLLSELSTEQRARRIVFYKRPIEQFKEALKTKELFRNLFLKMGITITDVPNCNPNGTDYDEEDFRQRLQAARGKVDSAKDALRNIEDTVKRVRRRKPPTPNELERYDLRGSIQGYRSDRYADYSEISARDIADFLYPSQSPDPGYSSKFRAHPEERRILEMMPHDNMEDYQFNRFLEGSQNPLRQLFVMEGYLPNTEHLKLR